MKARRKFLAAVSSMALVAAALLTGCGASGQTETSDNKTAAVSKIEAGGAGSITLSVNPEIRIDYDKDGKVMRLDGQNDDGDSIVDGYDGYFGKGCAPVIGELVAEIDEAGYFNSVIDGNEKNIIIQLEPGSAIPSDDFIEELTISAQEAVKALALSSNIVAIDDDDYDAEYAAKGSDYITLEKAKEIALAQAGVSAANAVFEDKEFDHDDGRAVFELEFTAGGVEYEYEVDAATGKVIKAEHSAAGATDYDDTDYGPNNDGVTDYDDTDYGPNNDGVTDYDDTDYGPNNDGVTDYTPAAPAPSTPAPAPVNPTPVNPAPVVDTDYDDTDYGDDGMSDYGDDGVSDYDDDDGESDYDD